MGESEVKIFKIESVINLKVELPKHEEETRKMLLNLIKENKGLIKDDNTFENITHIIVTGDDFEPGKVYYFSENLICRGPVGYK